MVRQVPDILGLCSTWMLNSAHTFRKHKRHLKIMGARRMPWSKLKH